jgi:beta-galactosidase
MFSRISWEKLLIVTGGGQCAWRITGARGRPAQHEEALVNGRVSGRGLISEVVAASVAVCGLVSGMPQVARAGEAGGNPANPPVGVEAAVSHHQGTTFDFDQDWRFALVNPDGITDPTGEFSGAERPEYDDSAWRSLHVPHDWSIELNPTSEGVATSSTGFYQGGLGWYRKTFTIPRSLAGKRLSVEFDGVYMDADVYFDGTWLATHHYGYTGFSVDLEGAHADGHTRHVLAVRVRNEIPSGRWYSGSGIYRNVRLVATGAIHVERWGSRITTPDLEGTSAAGYAIARVETTVVGPSDASTKAEVRSVLQDRLGHEVGRGTTHVMVTDTPVSATIDLRVEQPQLWDIDAPNLYRVTTEIVVDDHVVDRYVTRTGLRWTTFDPDTGFAINGRPRKLHGVNLHHDLGALGSAVNADALLRQLTTMKDMGVNALRTSHNPPAPELLALCDRLGIVVMVEAFDVWRTPKGSHDYARFFDADSTADLAEMVLESRNSPAVVMWSIGNEIPESAREDGVPIARRLVDTVRALDPTRPVVIGSNNYGSPPERGSAAEHILMMLDGVGLNYNTASSVDALHAAYPRTFLFLSESSSATSTRGVYDQGDQPNTGENHTPGRRGASSYENNLETWTASGEYALKMDRDRPWLLGQFLWSGYDYLGEPTPFDVFPVKASLFGAVDTAGFPKDRYHLFKSQWTSSPMVHIVPMDWTSYKPGEIVRVWVYSNVQIVGLFLNGRPLGERRFDPKTTAHGLRYLETTEEPRDDKTVTSGQYPGSYTGTEGTAGRLRLSWDVPFEPGSLVAVARRSGSSDEVARDEIRTAAEPAAIRLSAEHPTVASDPTALSFVTADVVDNDGVVVPDAQPSLRFSVTGGRLIGVDNGRQESAESYRAPHRTAFHGKALAIVAPDDGAGSMTVTAAGDGLRAGSVTVDVGEVVEWKRLRSQGRPPVTWTSPDAPQSPVPPSVTGAGEITADASFTGDESASPSAMIDGDLASGGWSNAYVQSASVLLAEVSAARDRDWVSVSWPQPRPVSGAIVWFGVDGKHAVPASVTAEYWDGQRWREIPDATLRRSSSPDEPSRVGCSQVLTSGIRLTMTSARPQQADGFIRIVELAPRFG